MLRSSYWNAFKIESCSEPDQTVADLNVGDAFRPVGRDSERFRAGQLFAVIMILEHALVGMHPAGSGITARGVISTKVHAAGAEENRILAMK